MPPILRVENLHHTYSRPDHPVQALRGVDLTVEEGEYVVLLGHNGSGKSTLARHLNALLLPDQGNVWVRQWNTRDPAHLRAIRSTVGMVFQHPDNQIVATIVEEEVAFGPENLGLDRSEIRRRVEEALTQVAMQPFRHRAPHLLSGGQKQRVCIAGVLAMQPQVLVLDEATAMLDPQGRRDLLALVARLHRKQGVTVIAVTHFMHEAIDADRVVVLHEGRVALQGPPRWLFQQPEALRALQLDLPPASELAQALHRRFPAFPADRLTPEEVATAVQTYRPLQPAPQLLPPLLPTPSRPPPLLELQHVAHFYMRGTPLEIQALSDVSLAVHPGEIVGVLGATGSGKSTAIQHCNGLLRAHAGHVRVLDQDLSDPKVDLRAVRRAVGLVFQLPETQLFEQYVGDDVAYGPRQLGLPHAQVRRRVQAAMAAVGLPFAAFKDRVTWTLSGGEMRRAAIAGVLALEPQLLVLDEPTAGLDPQARQLLLRQLLDLQAQGCTLVLVSHNMDELASLCHRLAVIAEGRTALTGSPAEVFAQPTVLRAFGLELPAMAQISERLQSEELLPPTAAFYTLAQAEATLSQLLAEPGKKPG